MAKRAILHATDFSTASRPALVKAIELSMIGDRPIEPPTYLELQKASRVWALKQLARVAARARARGVRATPILVARS